MLRWQSVDNNKDCIPRRLAQQKSRKKSNRLKLEQIRRLWSNPKPGKNNNFVTWRTHQKTTNSPSTPTKFVISVLTPRGMASIKLRANRNGFQDTVPSLHKCFIPIVKYSSSAACLSTTRSCDIIRASATVSSNDLLRFSLVLCTNNPSTISMSVASK